MGLVEKANKKWGKLLQLKKGNYYILEPKFSE